MKDEGRQTKKRQTVAVLFHPSSISSRRPEMSDVVPALQVRGLVRTFTSGPNQVEALRGVDLTVAVGEFVAVMGPSGSGKSTLLHLAAGLDVPTAGTVRVDGQLLGELDDDRLTLLRRRKLGFIFQAFNLLDVLTAEENVALPLVIDGVSELQASQRAGEALARVGLADRKGHLPAQLSGGEAQRVAIARAIVINPVLVLADEPTGNLDSSTGEQVLDLLRGLVDESGQTLLLVTHDARHAARADRLLRLRDGRVIEEQKLSPAARPLSEVLGELEGEGE
jgi:putative ABC transport system ATP-binding protein